MVAVPYTFTIDTVINPDEVNANFEALVEAVTGLVASFPTFYTFSQLKTLSVPLTTGTVYTSGWSVSGTGGAVYNVGSPADPPVPETPYSTNTLNGRPVTLNVYSMVMPEQFGAIPGTDCTAAVEAAAAYVSSLGGGAVFFSPGKSYGLQNCTLSPNVAYLGAGPTSRVYLVENGGNYAHPFFGGGLDRDTYYVRNWKPLNDVVPGASVVPTHGGDVSHFPVGSYAIVASTGALVQNGRAPYNIPNADWQPYFAIPVKVIANDGVNLTLEKGILDNIVGAQIALRNDYVSAPPPYSFGVDKWAVNNVFENFCIDCTTAPAGIQVQPWAVLTFYNCQIRNMRTVGAWTTASFNSFAYSVMEDVISEKMTPDANGVLRFLEIKTGTYCGVFRRIIGYCSATTTVANNALIESGEYANHSTVDNIKLYAPKVSVSFQFAVGTSAAPGVNNHFYNIEMSLASCSAFVSTPDGPTYAGNPSYTGYVMRNCQISSPYCAQTVRVVPNLSGGTCQFSIDGIESLKPNATQGLATIAAIALTDKTGFRDCRIANVVSDGPINFAPTAVAAAADDLAVTNCLVSGIAQTASYSPAVKMQPWQVAMSNIRRYRESAVRAGQMFNTGNNITSHALVDTVVAQTSFPNFVGAGYAYAFGDTWEIEIEIEFLGTNNQKYFSLVDVGTGSTILSVTGAAADNYLTNGNYRITGKLSVYDGLGVGTYSGSFTLSGGPSKQAAVALDTVFSSGPAALNLALHAHVDNAADGVQVSRMNVIYKPIFG